MDFKKEMHMRGKGQCLSIVKYKCSPHGKLSVRDNYSCPHWHCLSLFHPPMHHLIHHQCEILAEKIKEKSGSKAPRARFRRRECLEHREI